MKQGAERRLAIVPTPPPENPSVDSIAPAILKQGQMNVQEQRTNAAPTKESRHRSDLKIKQTEEAEKENVLSQSVSEKLQIATEVLHRAQEAFTTGFSSADKAKDQVDRLNAIQETLESMLKGAYLSRDYSPEVRWDINDVIETIKELVHAMSKSLTQPTQKETTVTSSYRADRDRISRIRLALLQENLQEEDAPSGGMPLVQRLREADLFRQRIAELQRDVPQHPVNLARYNEVIAELQETVDALETGVAEEALPLGEESGEQEKPSSEQDHLMHEERHLAAEVERVYKATPEALSNPITLQLRRAAMALGGFMGQHPLEGKKDPFNAWVKAKDRLIRASQAHIPEPAQNDKKSVSTEQKSGPRKRRSAA